MLMVSLFVDSNKTKKKLRNQEKMFLHIYDVYLSRKSLVKDHNKGIIKIANGVLIINLISDLEIFRINMMRSIGEILQKIYCTMILSSIPNL